MSALQESFELIGKHTNHSPKEVQEEFQKQLETASTERLALSRTASRLLLKRRR
jgi:hypothetical protein